MVIDINNIQKLLAEKKYDEARALISEISATPLTKEEKGAVLAGMASVYLDISNAISERYYTALNEAIEGLKKVKAAESKMGDTVRMKEIRNNLKN